MILEIAQIRIKPSMESEFERGVAHALLVFQRAVGCRGVELRKVLEVPGLYHLMVRWETLENHTVDFRGSEDFQVWRGCVAHCFETPPEVIHSSPVLAA